MSEPAEAVTLQTPDRRRIRAVRRQLQSPAGVLSLVVILVAVACALAPGLLAPHDPYQQSLIRRLASPSIFSQANTYYLGTDQLGRDILSRIIYGAGTTLFISLAAVAIACGIGTTVGLIAGYTGGRMDAIVLRLIDMQLAFPVILLVIAVVAVVGSSITSLIVIMGLAGWPQFARIIRSSVISVRDLEFVDAARSIGASPTRIIFRHVAPNVMSATIVFATFELSRMILIEATLSFLGLGVQPPTPTWGGMISEGQKYISLSWAASVFPGIAIAATILAINMLGDAMRDALDPRLANE
jgi:peptide/nickel transport system permease protein